MAPELLHLLRAAADGALGPPVRFAYLFGSHARGHDRPDSDVDIAVVLDDGIAATDAEQVGWRCADVLSLDPPQNVGC